MSQGGQMTGGGRNRHTARPNSLLLMSESYGGCGSESPHVSVAVRQGKSTP